jgi:hypothetical protein
VHALAASALAVLARADAVLFGNAPAAASTRADPKVDIFPLRKWGAVINLAVARDASLPKKALTEAVSVLCVSPPESEVPWIPRIIPTVAGDRAVVARSKRLRGHQPVRQIRMAVSLPGRTGQLAAVARPGLVVPMLAPLPKRRMTDDGVEPT